MLNIFPQCLFETQPTLNEGLVSDDFLTSEWAQHPLTLKGSSPMSLIVDGSMHIVVGDLQEKRVLGLSQNMLECGGLPSGLHANESHHAILAKTSVDGWEVKV